MTRKHFVELVEILADNNVSRQCVQDVMSFCMRHNRNFCETIFIDALKVKGWDNWQGLV
jgi:hypothetical protein